MQLKIKNTNQGKKFHIISKAIEDAFLDDELFDKASITLCRDIISQFIIENQDE